MSTRAGVAHHTAVVSLCSPAPCPCLPFPGAHVGRCAGRLGQVPQGEVHPEEGLRRPRERLPHGRGTYAPHTPSPTPNLTPHPHHSTSHPPPSHPPQGSTISWTPNAAKLASEVGVKLASYSEDWFGHEVDVVEMDGAVDKLEEIIYLESQVRPLPLNPVPNPRLHTLHPHTLHPHTLHPSPSTLHPSQLTLTPHPLPLPTRCATRAPSSTAS